jgi:hypothetical protein
MQKTLCDLAWARIRLACQISIEEHWDEYGLRKYMAPTLISLDFFIYARRHTFTIDISFLLMFNMCNIHVSQHVVTERPTTEREREREREREKYQAQGSSPGVVQRVASKQLQISGQAGA